MKKIEKAGIKGQKDGIGNTQSQSHSSGSVNQPTGAMKVASGSATMKNPKTAGGTGQERVGHKYIKREWMPTSQKWKYWYESPSGEYKYPSWEAKHDIKGVKPSEKDDLGHIQEAQTHFKRKISLLNSKIKEAKTLEQREEFKKQLNEVINHHDELEETADNLILEDATYKDQKFPDEAYKPRALSLSIGQYESISRSMKRALQSPGLSAQSKAELRSIQGEASTMKDYMTELSRQIEYQESIYGHSKPMVEKVAKAKNQAEKRLESAKQEQEDIKNLQYNMFSGVDKETNNTFRNHINNNLKDFFGDRPSAKKKDYEYKQNEQLESLNKVISDEDIGGVLHGHMDLDRNRLFLIQPSGGYKVKKVEDNLRKIKSEIAVNLEIPQKSIKITRPTNRAGMIGISIPKGDQGLTLVGLKGYLPKIKRYYDQNPIQNPYFLGMKMDQSNRRLKKEPLMVNLVDTHVFGGGMTGAGKSNNIILDIIAQKFIGRDVHSVIVDLSSFGEMQLIAEKLPNVDFVGEKKKAHQTLYAVYNEIKRRNDLAKEPDKIPEGGFPEIRLYMDEVNDLIDNLNSIKRSRMFEDQLDGITLIKNIARMGRKANVHIVSYGQNSKLKEIPSELRSQSITVGMYSGHTQMAGMPNGQPHLTKFGHMISGAGENVQESVQANVHSQDLAKLLGMDLPEKSSEKELFKNILRDKNVYYNVSKDIEKEDMSKTLSSPKVFSLFALKSQHKFNDSGKARKENDYRTILAYPDDLKMQANELEHNLNYNEIKANFKSYFEGYSETPAKNRKTNGQIRNMLDGIWKRHPDVEIQSIAKEFHSMVDNDLQHLPKIDEFDLIVPKPEKSEPVAKKEKKQKQKEVQKEVKRDVKKREASKVKTKDKAKTASPEVSAPKAKKKEATALKGDIKGKEKGKEKEKIAPKKETVKKETVKKEPKQKREVKPTSTKITSPKNILGGLNKNAAKQFAANPEEFKSKIKGGEDWLHGDYFAEHLTNEYVEGYKKLELSEEVQNKINSTKATIGGKHGKIQNHLILKYINDQMVSLRDAGHEIPEGSIIPEYSDENFYPIIDKALGGNASKELKGKTEKEVKAPQKGPDSKISEPKGNDKGVDTKKKEKVQESSIKAQPENNDAQVKRFMNLQDKLTQFEGYEQYADDPQMMQSVTDDVNTGLDSEDHYTVNEVKEVLTKRG